jgi:L-tyrosine C(3)-methyltransferase
MTTPATKEPEAGHELPSSAADLVPVLFGHAAFQHLNAACELGLHELLDASPGLSAEEIEERLGLSERSARILLLGTTALDLTRRRDDRYTNSAVIEDLFSNGSWPIFRDMVEFEARIAYLSHSNYVESLKADTNAGLAWFPGTEPDLYRRLEHSPALMELFYRCMNSWSRVANSILTGSNWFEGCRHVLDLGGGDGVNALALVRSFPTLIVTILDLEGAVAIARQKADDTGIGGRIETVAGDIFSAAYPDDCDCVLLANQIVIWSPADNLRLMARAYEALPRDGRLVIFNEFVDDTLDGPLYAALDNVYFATLPTRDSQIYRAGDCIEWAHAVGFREASWFPGHSWTPHGAVVAVK